MVVELRSSERRGYQGMAGYDESSQARSARVSSHCGQILRGLQVIHPKDGGIHNLLEDFRLWGGVCAVRRK